MDERAETERPVRSGHQRRMEATSGGRPGAAVARWALALLVLLSVVLYVARHADLVLTPARALLDVLAA